MDNRKDVLPIVMASAVALVVTGVIRWMIPGGMVIKQEPLKKSLSLPDIPLMVKNEHKKIKEVNVLVSNAEIKKDEKINMARLKWIVWPENAIHPSYIVQDSKGNPLNQKGDREKALTMWAKNDISIGVPITLSLLTSENPADVAKKKKEEEEKAKKELEQKRQEKQKKPQTGLVKEGYRAVSFTVDQRTPISTSMIAPGDYIDVRINCRDGGSERTYVYNALKIIAIDGVTSFNKEERKNSGGLWGGVGFGFSTPKNVTLEIEKDLVDTMLKQAQNSGIIITVRSQNERVDDSNVDVLEEQSDDNVKEQVESTTVVEDNKDSQDKQNEKFWMMNNQWTQLPSREIQENQHLSLMNSTYMSRDMSAKNESGKSGDSSTFEWVSGRMVPEATDKEKEREAIEKDEPVDIYRKLAVEREQFYKNGKKVTTESENRIREAHNGIER